MNQEVMPDYAPKKVWEGLGFVIPNIEMPSAINRNGQEVFHYTQVLHCYKPKLQEAQ